MSLCTIWKLCKEGLLKNHCYYVEVMFLILRGKEERERERGREREREE
jgi:hypothetical protein